MYVFVKFYDPYLLLKYFILPTFKQIIKFITLVKFNIIWSFEPDEIVLSMDF